MKRLGVTLSREDSLERLSECGFQFPDISTPTPDDEVVKGELFDLLDWVIGKLTDDEFRLIQEFFYFEKTEREVCRPLYYPKFSLHRKKEQIIKS